jgi:hypothetical protein
MRPTRPGPIRYRRAVGWLGKAKVVGFEGEADRFGSPTWDIFVAEPEPRGDERGQALQHRGDAPGTPPDG